MVGHEPVALWPNRDAVAAADVVHIVPASQRGCPQSRPKQLLSQPVGI